MTFCDDNNGYNSSEPFDDRGLDFWWDGQLRRLHLHFNSLFSNFKYEYIDPATGTKRQRRVLARGPNRDRLVAAVQNQNSDVIMKSAPIIITHMTDVQYNPTLQQDPFVSQVERGHEVLYDDETGEWLNQPGPRYEIERIMSQPFNVTMKMELWTTSEIQKHMIMEQIMPLVVPSLDLYTSENVYDWTALKVIRLTNMQWSSRTLPLGTSTDLDIASMTFEIPTWLNLPAKLREDSSIRKIETNMRLLSEPNIPEGAETEEDENDFFIRIICKPDDNQILVEDNTVKLLGSNGLGTKEDGSVYKWSEFFEKARNSLRPGISQLALNLNDDPKNEEGLIKGMLDFGDNDNTLIWSPDIFTIPEPTIDPVDAFIEPNKVYPGQKLPSAKTGQRYIAGKELAKKTEAWGDISEKVKANDIIEYDGTKWNVVWRAQEVHDFELVQNKDDGKLLLWNGEEWVVFYEGVYRVGYWKILF